MCVHSIKEGVNYEHMPKSDFTVYNKLNDQKPDVTMWKIIPDHIAFS